MKSKKFIIIISIIIALLVIILALLVNHITCNDGESSQVLLNLDAKTVKIFNTVTNPIKKAAEYLKYLFLKVTAIQTPEYPSDNFPLYQNSRVISYIFDENTNTLNISSGTNDSFDTIASSYFYLFSNEITVDYFKEYIFDNKYLAYGMIGNFSFLLEAAPSENKKYSYEINTELHYLIEDELAAENFFRKQVVPNSFLFSNPYIYMYQKQGDTEYIYLQLRDYKSQMLSIDTHVNLYIDGEFYSSRYYGDTIRVPITELYNMHNIKMISFDNNNCIRALDIMENVMCYDANGKIDFYDLASEYSKAKNLFLINSDDIEDISYLIYFTELQSLYLNGNEKIKHYTTILSLSSLTKLFLTGVNDDIIYRLDALNSLNVLEISNCELNISLGNNFTNLVSKELELNNCTNLSFAETGYFSVNLERLSINYNYSLKNIAFIATYPNIHIIDLSYCDGLTTVFNLSSLPNLNALSIDNCQQFDLTQPLDNTPSLMNVEFCDNAILGKSSESYIHSIWANANLVTYSVSNCYYINEIYYFNQPWEKVN